MRILSLLTVLISLNALSIEICHDSKKLAETEHKHFFFADDYKKMPKDTNEKRALKDFTLIDGVATKVRLELINFDTIEGGDQVAKDINIARAKFEKVLASTEFKTEVLKHKYRGKLGFKKSNRKSNNEIYEIILAGADKYNRTVDNEIDMILCPYFSDKEVLGYTYRSRKEVWLNFKYYRDGHNDFDTSSMVGNLLHEWIHNTGFGHAKKKNNTRHFTVPYAIGYMARDIAGKLDQQTCNTSSHKTSKCPTN